MAEKDSATETDVKTEDPKKSQESQQEQGGKTFTQAELEAEADRRATAARKAAIADYEKKIEDERKKAEAERLAEQGEFKTLHEKARTELETLKTQLAAKEQREKISAGLREAGLTQFETVLLADRNTPEDFVASAKSLAELVKTSVDAEVAKRLETGKKAESSTSTSDKPTGFVYPSMQKTA